MTNIKAVIMDGDGSTITHDEIFPDNLRSLIINNQHIKWIMATGRSFDLLRRLPIIDYLSKDVPHILDGGSRLTMYNGKSILDHYLSHAEIENFFAQLDIDKVNFIYYYLNDEQSYIFSPSNIDHWRAKPQFTQAKATDNLDEYKDWALTNIPTKIFLHVTSNIKLDGLNWHQNEHCIDLTACGTTKGSCCTKLLKMLQLTPEEVAFVFNDRNDLPLVLHPELTQITTIKVGNYLPDIVAHHHAADPYEVAGILAKLL